MLISMGIHFKVWWMENSIEGLLCRKLGAGICPIESSASSSTLQEHHVVSGRHWYILPVIVLTLENSGSIYSLR